MKYIISFNEYEREVVLYSYDGMDVTSYKMLLLDSLEETLDSYSTGKDVDTSWDDVVEAFGRSRYDTDCRVYMIVERSDCSKVIDLESGKSFHSGSGLKDTVIRAYNEFN